ncbi:B3/4 domain-containing protein [Lederbergia wuyishanensis]|uniref:DNA/RNA-binding domain of Phe-tRNA-synthetase-like protein n=1 Tax=Lederbergia wuyishanensis TaxID=1347903 RepID=A0ABU0CYI5_9BACI|nr:phenylalanine--tRNA ligase beta subunit-related protein [Lederbergia wuyishanensis]MCJ8005847.1 hypothetical protein [Lederbergia wuyishanensis]MDQ0341212.1 DNA/RNA-binding domain of Phe-tRNA-synthetase-like protein [Lederbergia wuyishanensis]
MEIHIDSDLRFLLPELIIGIIDYENIIVEESPQMLKGRLQLFQESLFFDLEDKNVSDYAEIKEWRRIFKQLGKDPNRYRHSAEALYRRVKKQQFLPSTNSATDVNNFFSLKYRVPFGIYDKDKIIGDIVIRIGQKDEGYEGLNGRENQLEHLLLSVDNNGPFGSPFVDSTRTAVTHNTKNALQIIYLPSSIDDKSANELLASLSGMFTQINGGEGRFKVIKAAT